MPEISSTLSWAKPSCDLPVVHSQTNATDKSDIDMDLGIGKGRTRVDDLVVIFEPVCTVVDSNSSTASIASTK